MLITAQWVMMMGSYTLCGLFGAISPFLGKKSFLTLNAFLPKLPRWPRFHWKIWVFLPKTDLNITYSPINESKVGNFDLQVVFNIYLVDLLSLKSFWVSKTEKFDVLRQFLWKSVQNGNSPPCTLGSILGKWGKKLKFCKKDSKVE